MMTFRELLTQYKAGTLPEDQKNQVEAEIEKYEAISDYLYEDEPLSIPEKISAPDDKAKPETDQFTKTIRSAIRRTFIRMGTVIGTVVLALVLAVIFVLPGVVSTFYYNPNEVVGTNSYGQEINRMSLDLTVFSELCLPDNQRDTVVAEDEGYGTYAITIPQTFSYGSALQTVSGKLEQGKLHLYAPQLLEMPAANVFVLPEDVEWPYHGVGAAGSVDDALYKMDMIVMEKPYDYYTAYISLAHPMDYETFYSTYQKNAQNCYNLWCGVYTGNTSPDFLGFRPESCCRPMAWDQEAYPMLLLCDNQEEGNVRSAADQKTHFTSMLRYMKDNPQAMELFGTNNIIWEDVLNYVEENGLQIYGFTICGTAEAIGNLVYSDGMFAYAYLEPV